MGLRALEDRANSRGAFLTMHEQLCWAEVVTEIAVN